MSVCNNGSKLAMS